MHTSVGRAAPQLQVVRRFISFGDPHNSSIMATRTALTHGQCHMGLEVHGTCNYWYMRQMHKVQGKVKQIQSITKVTDHTRQGRTSPQKLPPGERA